MKNACSILSLLFTVSVVSMSAFAEGLDCLSLLRSGPGVSRDFPKETTVFEVVDQAKAEVESRRSILKTLEDQKVELDAEVLALEQAIASKGFKQSVKDWFSGSVQKNELKGKRTKLGDLSVAIKNAQGMVKSTDSNGQRLIGNFVAHVAVETFKQSLIDPKHYLRGNLTVSSMPSTPALFATENKISGIAIVQSTVYNGSMKFNVRYPVHFEMVRGHNDFAAVMFTTEKQTQDLYAYDVFKPGSVVDASGRPAKHITSYENRLSQIGIFDVDADIAALTVNAAMNSALAKQIAQVLVSTISYRSQNGPISNTQRDMILSYVKYWAALKSPDASNMMKTSLMIQALGLPEVEMTQFTAALSKEALQTTPSVERIQRNTTSTWENSTSSYSTTNDSTFAILMWMNMNNWIITSGQLNDVNRIDDNSVREQINNIVGSDATQDLSSQDYGTAPGASSDTGSGGGNTDYGSNNNDTGSSSNNDYSAPAADYSSPSVDTTSF